MNDGETLLIEGARRFSQYGGYRTTFVWQGPYEPPKGIDRSVVEQPIIAFDAIAPGSGCDHWSRAGIDRELGKVLCACMDSRQADRMPAVPRSCCPLATGNWGCGAFGGDPGLKAALQWIAASQAGRRIRYAAFGNADLAAALRTTSAALTGAAGAPKQGVTTVGAAYRCVLQAAARRDGVHLMRQLCNLSKEQGAAAAAPEDLPVSS